MRCEEKKFSVVPFIVQRVLFNENYSIIKWEMRKFRWKDELRRFLFFFRHHHQRIAILFYYPRCRRRCWWWHTNRRMWNLNRGGMTVQIIVILQNTLITQPFTHSLTHFRVTTRILFSSFKQFFSSGSEWGFIIQLFWWFFNSTLKTFPMNFQEPNGSYWQRTRNGHSSMRQNAWGPCTWRSIRTTSTGRDESPRRFAARAIRIPCHILRCPWRLYVQVCGARSS